MRFDNCRASDTEGWLMFPAEVPDIQNARMIDLFQGPAANLTLDWDVAVCNRWWSHVFTGLQPGMNLIEWLFLDPVAQQMPDWDHTARQFLLWYLDAQERDGGSKRALQLLVSCAAGNPALKPLLVDADPTEVRRVWTEPAPIVATDPETGLEATFRFQVNSPIGLDPRTLQKRPTAYYTMLGVADR
ncbi:MmyB family transcriptional regulator [Nocardia gipuzkoensis]